MPRLSTAQKTLSGQATAPRDWRYIYTVSIFEDDLATPQILLEPAGLKIDLVIPPQ